MFVSVWGGLIFNDWVKVCSNYQMIISQLFQTEGTEG